MSKRGRGGSSGGKFRISLALPVAAVMNCADNTGRIYYMSVASRSRCAKLELANDLLFFR